MVAFSSKPLCYLLILLKYPTIHTLMDYIRKDIRIYSTVSTTKIAKQDIYVGNNLCCLCYYKMWKIKSVGIQSVGCNGILEKRLGCPRSKARAS